MYLICSHAKLGILILSETAYFEFIEKEEDIERGFNREGLAKEGA